MYFQINHMAQKCDQKYALVTGGNRGIGFEICKELLKAGFNIILTSRSLDKAKTAASNLAASTKFSVRGFEMDVTDDSSIRSMVKSLSLSLPHLDVLINNAGVLPDQNTEILTVSRNLLQIGMNTNALGVIHVTQALLPLLNKARSARVINISSERGQLSHLAVDTPSYSLSKLALNGATILLARALQPKNISVYAVWPGWVRTDMGGEHAPRTPEESTDTVIWLATEASANLTGKYFYDRKEISYG
jgi:NAD(P)-dependent dehydrogenase (short-subunit alcohol dehydrogenase family)